MRVVHQSLLVILLFAVSAPSLPVRFTDTGLNRDVLLLSILKHTPRVSL
jgi:hypothetical protein